MFDQSKVDMEEPIPDLDEVKEPGAQEEKTAGKDDAVPVPTPSQNAALPVGSQRRIAL